MTDNNKQLARDFFAALCKGELPDSLITSDLKAWTTISGPVDKAAYQGMIAMLGQVFKGPLTMHIDSLTAEEDRVVAEVRSEGTLANDEPYANSYVFIFRIQDGRIASLAEHFNSETVKKKMGPLMKR